jgi:hypothetical protein
MEKERPEVKWIRRRAEAEVRWRYIERAEVKRRRWEG